MDDPISLLELTNVLRLQGFDLARLGYYRWLVQERRADPEFDITEAPTPS